MRRTLITVAAAAVVVGGAGGVAIATHPGSAITKARLEHSVNTSFSNVYSQEAALLGHKGVTPASMTARTMCDKGPGVAQSGPGTNWNCLTSWHDPAVPMPSTGYGKLEVTVHSNGCYTVGSPSTLVGYQTITDDRGKTVNNPAYEFDGCLDPNSDNTPTGVSFQSELKLTNTTARVDSRRRVGADLACNVGSGGCHGSVTATAGKRSLGTVPFDLAEQATTHLTFPGALPAGEKKVTYTFHGSKGIMPSPSTIPVQG